VFFDLIHLAHDLIGVCPGAIMQVPALIARRVDLSAGDSNQTEPVRGRDRRSPLVARASLARGLEGGTRWPVEDSGLSCAWQR
jgi:hypothetical protein